LCARDPLRSIRSSGSAPLPGPVSRAPIFLQLFATGRRIRLITVPKHGTARAGLVPMAGAQVRSEQLLETAIGPANRLQ
jgi:hypothetical protein